MYNLQCIFSVFRRHNHSPKTLFPIGPKEYNPVVEANKKNALFMRAWDECAFILETLFKEKKLEKARKVKKTCAASKLAKPSELQPKCAERNVRVIATKEMRDRIVTSVEIKLTEPRTDVLVKMNGVTTEVKFASK